MIYGCSGNKNNGESESAALGEISTDKMTYRTNPNIGGGGVEIVHSVGNGIVYQVVHGFLVYFYKIFTIILLLLFFLLSMYGFQRHHNHTVSGSLRPFGFLTACPGHHTHNGTVRSHAPALFFPW